MPPTETKPGFKTSEFVVFVLVNLGTWLDIIPVPDKYKWLVTLATTVGYSVARGLAKQGVANFEVPVSDPPEVLEEKTR